MVSNSVLFVVWRNRASSTEQFAESLFSFIDHTASSSTPVNQCNLDDAAVRAASSLRQLTFDPAPEAMLSVSLPHPDGAADVFDAIAAPMRRFDAIGQVHGYAVSSRVPLVDHEPEPRPGTRRRGWSQLAFLRRIADSSDEAFRSRWFDHHTRVAVSTQSTFRYVQHLIDRPFSGDAPPLDGIVEECFPTEAMTDPHAFFATGGDPQVLRERITTMVDSVATFLDLARLDVIPTSEYRFETQPNDHRNVMPDRRDGPAGRGGQTPG